MVDVLSMVWFFCSCVFYSMFSFFFWLNNVLLPLLFDSGMLRAFHALVLPGIVKVLV